MPPERDGEAWMCWPTRRASMPQSSCSVLRASSAACSSSRDIGCSPAAARANIQERHCKRASSIRGVMCKPSKEVEHMRTQVVPERQVELSFQPGYHITVQFASPQGKVRRKGKKRNKWVKRVRRFWRRMWRLAWQACMSGPRRCTNWDRARSRAWKRVLAACSKAPTHARAAHTHTHTL